MPKVDIWMPIYIGDYLRDTAELSDAEHGAYILLLMHYWQKNGEIGCDIERLARVARTQEETARFILGSYFTLEDGNYRNKRADIEMENAETRRTSARENGLKGGRPPKNNPQKTGGLPAANPTPNPQKSSSSSSSPSSSPIPSREREEPKDDFTTRFENIKKIWNDSGLKPPIKKTTFDLMQDERTAIAGTMRHYSDDDIAKAMGNYQAILDSSEHEIENPYHGLIGFMRGGVEKFVAEADPWSAYKKRSKGFETAGEREERERAEAIARIGKMGA